MEAPSVSPGFYGDSIFWIEVDKIRPNPYQPRRDFDEAKLRELAESIRQYGILQPLTVTRREFEKDGGGLGVFYELVAGERRLRASKLLGLNQVPVLIRTGVDDDREKLELAIIENLQREDLNSIDRAVAFQRLASEFNLKQAEIAAKVGMSREFVANTIRLLQLPEDMQKALVERKISEGHSRPLLMLDTRKEEQAVLFKEIMERRLTVREAESIARRIAQDRARAKHHLDPELLALERELMEALGTRVSLEKKEKGGKIVIDFFTPEDLRAIVQMLHREGAQGPLITSTPIIMPKLDQAIAPAGGVPVTDADGPTVSQSAVVTDTPMIDTAPVDDSNPQEAKEAEDLYSLKNFSL